MATWEEDSYSIEVGQRGEGRVRVKGISGGRNGMNELRVERTYEYDRDKHHKL
jgi:hypothetical protein